MRAWTWTWALCLVLPLSAYAGRPFTTDDAGVLGSGECEVESYFFRERAQDAPSTSGGWLQPGCGYGYRSQLSLGAGRERSDGMTAGLYALSGKTWMKELKDSDWGFALGYGFGWVKQPNGSRRFDSTSLNAIVTVPAGPLLMHANLGWTRSRLDHSTASTWGVLAEWEEALGPVDAGIEAFGDDHSAPW
jgi:hypothetical protein